MVLQSRSVKETLELGKKLGSKLLPELVCLFGPLGVGKTVLVRGIAKGMGVASRIQSPTFTYLRVHKGKKFKLYHFDCYRISKPDMLLLHELNEALERNDGITVIEWAEKIRKYLPHKRINIYIKYDKNDGQRSFKINP